MTKNVYTWLKTFYFLNIKVTFFNFRDWEEKIGGFNRLTVLKM